MVFMKTKKRKIQCPAFPDCPKIPSKDNPECKYCPWLPKEKSKKVIKEKKLNMEVN